MSEIDNIVNKYNINVSIQSLIQKLNEELSGIINELSTKHKELESEEIHKIELNIHKYLDSLKSAIINNVSELFLSMQQENYNIQEKNKEEIKNILEKSKEENNQYINDLEKKILEQDDKEKCENNEICMTELLEKEIIKEENICQVDDTNNEQKNEISTQDEQNNTENILSSSSEQQQNNNNNNDSITNNEQSNNNENLSETITTIEINNKEQEQSINEQVINKKAIRETYLELIKQYSNNITNLMNENYEKINKIMDNELIKKIEISNINERIKTVYEQCQQNIKIQNEDSNEEIKKIEDILIFSNDSKSTKELSKILEDKAKITIEKYENMYKSDIEENECRKLNNIKVEVNKIKDKYIEKSKELEDEIKNIINEELDLIVNNHISEERIQLEKENEEQKLSNQRLIDDSVIQLNENYEKRIELEREEVRKQLEKQMVEEKQNFVKSLRAGFESEKSHMEKCLHDEFEIEISRILEENYKTVKGKEDEIKKHCEDKEALNNTIASLKYEIVKCNSTNRQKLEENERLINDLNNHNCKLNDELKKLKTELEGYEEKANNEKDIIRQELNQYKDSLSVVETAKMELSKRFDEEFMQKEQEMLRAKQKIKELTLENQESEENFNKQRQEMIRQNESTKASLLMNQEEFEQMKEAKLKLNEKLENLSSKYNTLCQELEVSKTSCDRNSKTVLENQEKIKQYKKKTQELTHINENLQKKIEMLTADFANVEQELNQIKDIDQKKEIQLNDVNNQYNTLSIKIKELTDENEKLVKANQELEEKIKEIENELRVSDRKKIQIIKDLQKQLKKEQKSKAKSESNESVMSISPKIHDMASPVLEYMGRKNSSCSNSSRRSNSNNRDEQSINYSNNNSGSNSKIPESISSSSYSNSSATIKKIKIKSSDASSIKSPILESMKSGSASSAKVTQKIFTPEEKIRILSKRNKKLSEELATKSKVLQQYILQEHSAELQPDQVTKPKQFFNLNILSNGKALQKTDPAIVTQINLKLQKLIEDLTTKNVILEEEIEKLKNDKTNN